MGKQFLQNNKESKKFMTYDEFDNLEKPKDEFIEKCNEILRELEYSPIHEKYLMKKCCLNKKELYNFTNYLRNEKMIKLMKKNDSIYFGLKDSLRKYYPPYTRLEFDTFKIVPHENKQIIEVIFPSSNRKNNSFIIEIPIKNFFVAFDAWLGSLDLEMPYLKEDFKIDRFFIAKHPDTGKKVFRLVTRKQRIEILERQDYNCNNCGCDISNRPDEGGYTKLAYIDHIHPYALRHLYPNGPEMINESENLQALCYDCNMAKSKKMN